MYPRIPCIPDRCSRGSFEDAVLAFDIYVVTTVTVFDALLSPTLFVAFT